VADPGSPDEVHDDRSFQHVPTLLNRSIAVWRLMIRGLTI